MNIKEFLENKDRLETELSYRTGDSDSIFMVLWETAHDCPVHDGFYDDDRLSYIGNQEELLACISGGLNTRHVRDLARARVVDTRITEVEQIGVHYEASGHRYVSIRVDGLGLYHDIGNGTMRWDALNEEIL